MVKKDMKDYKVLFADLDGTLIETASGSTFPQGIWDMKIRYDVLDAIKRCNVEHLAVVSNQGGIELRCVDENSFIKKAEYLKVAFAEYLGINVTFDYCRSNNKNDVNRKPNVGMLQDCYKNFISEEKFYSKKNMLMIGDASGKPDQFSDSDFKTAENFGIDYLDVEDFLDIVEKEFEEKGGKKKHIKNRKRELKKLLSKNGIINENNPHVNMYFNHIWDAVLKIFPRY